MRQGTDVKVVANLRDIAVKAVDGKFTVANLPKDPPAAYNSGAMLEMHANLSLTSAAEVDAKVKIAAPPTRDINVRRTVEPDPQTVRNVVADLFLNKDTWEFDAGKAPGEQRRRVRSKRRGKSGIWAPRLDAGVAFCRAACSLPY